MIITAFSVFLFSEVMVFDPNTGEQVQNANCEQYYDQINEVVKKQNSWGTAVEGSEEAKAIDKQANVKS